MASKTTQDKATGHKVKPVKPIAELNPSVWVALFRKTILFSPCKGITAFTLSCEVVAAENLST